MTYGISSIKHLLLIKAGESIKFHKINTGPALGVCRITPMNVNKVVDFKALASKERKSVFSNN